MNRLRIEREKNYLRERFIALCKEIVWSILETDTNLVKHAIRFGLFNISSTPITAHSGAGLLFLIFQMAYLTKESVENRRRENTLCQRFIALCDIVRMALQTDTNSVKHAIRFWLFSIPSTPNHCVQ